MNNFTKWIAQRSRHGAAVTGILALWMVVAAPHSARAQDTEKLTLRQAVTLALQNSRDVKLAQMQYNVALGEVGVDRAAFRPNLYTGSGIAYSHGFPALPGGEPPALFRADYTQTLFNPLLKGDQHAAEERANNHKLELDRTRSNVIVRTATTYLELGKVRHSLDLMRGEQASGEKILQAIRDRIAVSQELPIEDTRSQLMLARIQERVVKLEDRDAALEAEIRDLTAFPDGQSIEVEPEDASFAAQLATAQLEEEIVRYAIQNDPAVLEAQNDRTAREQELRGTRLSRWPSIDLVGEYSVLSKINNYDAFYKTFERNNLNVGLQITIPLFAAKTYANISLAKSQLTAAELTLNNKRQEVRLDVQQKARDVRELEASRDVARLDLQLAQENLQLEQAKFDQNRITLQEIEQARLDENDKWVAFLDADFARQRAQLTLLEATGQLAKVFP